MRKFGLVFSSLLFSITAVCQDLPSRCAFGPDSLVACTFLTSSVTNGTGENWAASPAGSGRDIAFFGESGNAAADVSGRSVRGFVSGTLMKKMDLPVESFKNDAGERTYRIAK